MKSTKSRILATLLCLCLVFSLLPVSVLAADYDDTDGHWAENEIDRWTEAGVVHGEGNGEFNPDGNMTRAEAAQVFVNLLKLKDKADITAYADVDPDAWYADAIAKVVKAGIMNGVASNAMAPEETLTREQMFVMMGRALGVEPADTCDKTFADGAETDSWAQGYINALVNMGVINGVDSTHIAPLDDINRASVMKALDNLIGGYAYEEGQTVEIVEGKITLIVADDVTVTGTADPDLPIIVAGEAGTVDMKDVEGETTVQVQVSDVAIENAPVGTEIKAAEDVENVTANDIDVSGDADKDVVIPEPEPSTPSYPSYPSTPSTPTDTTTAETIDGIIETGRQAVNTKMVKDNIPYAVIPEFEKSGSPRKVTVTIYDSTTTVGAIYNDIVGTLVDALKNNASRVTSITAVTDIGGQTVTAETEGQNYKKTIELNSNVSNNDVILFVKALVGQEYHQATDIKGLVGKNFVVEVSDSGKDDVPTTVQYKVTFEMASLDDVIAEKIQGIDDKMDYATLDWDADSHTLNVDINSSTTDINTVYQAIATPLCDAFNLVRGQLQTVQDAVKDQSGKTLDINDAIINTDLLEFIKALQLVNSLDSTEKKDLTAVLSSGRDSLIAALKGYQFEIQVTPKSSLPEGASTLQKYTIKFIAPALDDVIAKEIPNISAKMKEQGYAYCEWDGTQHTLNVTITNGETPVGTVYNDIAGMLCTAFNESRNTLKSVKDALNSENGSELKLDTALTDTALKEFVKGLKLKNSTEEEAKALTDILKNDQGLKISGLSGYHFEINVTTNGQEEAVKYTISFTVTGTD